MSGSLRVCSSGHTMPTACSYCTELVQHIHTAMVRTCEHCEAGAARQPGQQRVEGECGRHRHVEELHGHSGDSAYVSGLVQQLRINRGFWQAWRVQLDWSVVV
jgi:hypothetical protein